MTVGIFVMNRLAAASSAVTVDWKKIYNTGSKLFPITRGILTDIARDLAKEIKNNIKIDWTVKESVLAEMRVKIKRLLRKHGYPPDKQERATLTVLQQAELLCRDWAPLRVWVGNGI